MTAKKDRLLLKLGVNQKKWDAHLRTLGLPKELRPTLELGEGCFDVPYSQVRPLDEGRGPGPLGQERKQSDGWKRSAGFLRVIVTCLLAASVPKNQQRHLTELRSQDDDLLPRYLPTIPDDLGTPEEFFLRWKRGEVDVRVSAPTRQKYSIELWEHSIPPDDDDSPEDAAGHWDGLMWEPDQPGS